jgi:hypothetical protein
MRYLGCEWYNRVLLHSQMLMKEIIALFFFLGFNFAKHFFIYHLLSTLETILSNKYFFSLSTITILTIFWLFQLYYPIMVFFSLSTIFYFLEVFLNRRVTTRLRDGEDFKRVAPDLWDQKINTKERISLLNWNKLTQQIVSFFEHMTKKVFKSLLLKGWG